MVADLHYPNLFSPIRIDNFEVQNRIVMVPTCINSANTDGSVNERVLMFNEQVAKGGCGFIIVGATTPDKSTGRGDVNCIAADDDVLIPGLASLAEVIHRYGAKCAVQIQLPQPQAAYPDIEKRTASDIAMRIPGSAGRQYTKARGLVNESFARAITKKEIYYYIEKCAQAAWRLKEAGFDSIEIHGTHGYLISQFMSPYLNKRHDRYGGNFRNRMRFLTEIIDAIKEKCGEDFTIGLRYSAEEWVPGGRTLGEGIEVAKLMENYGVKYLDISAGIFEVAGPVMDPSYYPQGWNTYTAEAVKKHVKIPVITSHTLRDPGYCEKILKEEKTDLVGFSRQFISDPLWPIKAKMGQKKEIRKCISCLIGCWGESHLHRKHVRCTINPAIGDERFLMMNSVKKPYNIAIIGGGPAGMEAGRIATLRGHKITIFEKTGELGGSILYCCSVHAKSKMRWYADWIRNQIKKLNIEVKYNWVFNKSEITKYDVIIIATGGRVTKPNIRGIEQEFVIIFEDILRCNNKKCEFYPEDKKMPVECGEKVLIYGDNYAAADCAEKLGVEGKEIIIVTKENEFAEWMEPVYKDVMLKRFVCSNGEGLKSKTFKYPVSIFTNSKILEIDNNKEILIINQDLIESKIKVDNIIICDIHPSGNDLNKELSNLNKPTVRIGDCKEVKNLRAAVTSGANIGLEIDENFIFNPNNEIAANIEL